MEDIQEPQVARMCSRNPENPSDRGKSNGRFVQMLELKHDGTSNTLTSVQKDNLVVEPQIIQAGLYPARRWNQPRNTKVQQVGNIYPDTDNFKNRTMGRVYDTKGLSPTLNCCGGGDREPKIVEPHFRIRKLTPRECFRLMDVDDNVIDKIQAAGISNSQQYKMAGNSIVVACLYGIFEQMFYPKYTNSGTLF